MTDSDDIAQIQSVIFHYGVLTNEEYISHLHKK